MPEDLSPRPEEGYAAWIERADPALARRSAEIADFDTYSIGFSNGMLAALWELRDVPPELSKNVLTAVIIALMRQRNSRRFVTRLLAESRFRHEVEKDAAAEGSGPPTQQGGEPA
ncbi:MAG TPA: hypothetical protein VGK89_01140 [Candidatus Eisenbacteria bacterium]|jgi:hypothetical protein